MPCTNGLDENVAWTNQESFNHANFSLESKYDPLQAVYYGDSYIHEAKFGVAYSGVNVLHTKVDRNGTIHMIIN